VGITRVPALRWGGPGKATRRGGFSAAWAALSVGLGTHSARTGMAGTESNAACAAEVCPVLRGAVLKCLGLPTLGLHSGALHELAPTLSSVLEGLRALVAG